MGNQIDIKASPNWKWAKLDDICTQVTDGTHITPRYVSKGIRFISIANLRPFEPLVFTSYEKFITLEEHKELTRRCKPERDDILITKIGTLGIAKRIDFDEEVSIFVGLAIAKPNKELVYPAYLEAYLNSPQVKMLAVNRAQGGGRKTLPIQALKQFPIPLPPLPEQMHIAARLNEQMAAVAQARRSAEENLKAARELPSAYLREVFECEEANMWDIVKLRDLSTLIQNGIYKSADFYGHGHPFLRMYNLSNQSWNLVLEKKAQVDITNQEFSKYRLRNGDLLISRVNSFELVGKCGLVDERAEDYVFENMLIRIRTSDNVNSMFIAQQMQTPAIRKQIEAVAKKAIGQSSINSNDLRELKLAIPPLSIQTRISEQISERFLSCSQLTTSLEYQVAEINRLPSALLRRAFSGGL